MINNATAQNYSLDCSQALVTANTNLDAFLPDLLIRIVCGLWYCRRGSRSSMTDLNDCIFVPCSLRKLSRVSDSFSALPHSCCLFPLLSWVFYVFLYWHNVRMTDFFELDQSPEIEPG